MENDNPQRPPIVIAVNRTKFRAILFSIAMCAGVGAGVFLASRAVIDTWNVRQIEKLKLRLVAEGDLSLAEQIKLRGGDPTECYVRLLMHSDAEVRRDAVWALGAPPISDRAARSLLRSLTDNNQLDGIKALVLYELGKIGQRKIGPLSSLESEFLTTAVHLLDSTDSTVRSNAVDALNQFGSRRGQLGERIFALLDDSDYWVRMSVARFCLENHPTRSGLVVEQLLKDSMTPPSGQNHAVGILWELANGEFPVAEEKIGRESPELRDAISRELARLEESL